MKNITSMIFRVISFLFIVSLGMLHPAYADMEWTLKKQLNLETAPLDITTSFDGQWVFVLTAGEVLVYSIPEDKMIKRIPVDKTYDRLSYSAPDNTLIVSSSAGKAIKFIQLDLIYKFAVSDLPFKGPQNAAVTIAVFSDYQ